jgi:hypothetical protein
MPIRIIEEELGLESVCHIPTINLRVKKACVKNVCLLYRIRDEPNFFITSPLGMKQGYFSMTLRPNGRANSGRKLIPPQD